MIKLKKLLIEASSKKLTQIVKELRSSDFGMTEDGGNGMVLAKGGKLIIRDPYYYSPDNKRLHLYKKEWDENGTYGKYFNDKYGVKFNVDYVKLVNKKLQNLPGYVEVQVTVNESNG